MSYRFQTAFCTIGILCGSICLAQNYRCGWNVVGIAGGEMTGVYKCGSTVGQTAVGLVTGSNYWALIGFWQPEGQVARRAAVVARERELRTAAEGRAVQCGDDWLAAGFETQKYVVEQRLARRRVELADIRPGDEVTAATMNHDGTDASIRVERLDRRQQCGSHRLRERVDRRMLDLDQPDLAEPRHRHRGGARFRHATRSSTAAMPWPTPMHIEHSA